MKRLACLTGIAAIVLGLCAGQANAQPGKTVVVTRPGSYTMDMEDQRGFMGPYILRIVNDGSKGLRVSSLTLHSGAWMGAWSLTVFYPGGTQQFINPYKMGTSIPIEEWMAVLSPGQSLRIQVNNASLFATKFRAEIGIR